MEFTIEVVHAIITAVVTGLLGSLFKNTVIPARLIPIQNLIIGVISAVVAVALNLYDNYLLATLISLGMSFGVGGVYDATKTKSK